MTEKLFLTEFAVDMKDRSTTSRFPHDTEIENSKCFFGTE